MHHDDRERLELLGERCARSGEDFEMHFRVLLGQGERWLFGRAMNVRDQAGRPSYLVGACIDVTEHKRTELALQRLNDTLESRVDEAIAARAAAESALHQAQKMERSVSSPVASPMTSTTCWVASSARSACSADAWIRAATMTCTAISPVR